VTELPICAAILAAETGLPESKAVSLIEEMRRSGMAVMHSDEEMMRGYLSRVCEAVYAAKEEKKA
jgi:ribulose 1,5-bisphosphate carboxylase large subunit-like protein